MRSPNGSDRTVEPRQARARATRAALLAAVERVCAREGADAVTTTRIAAETGASVGTIYRYFADREALLLAAYDGTVTRIVRRCGQALDTLDPGLDVRRAARRVLALYLEAAEAEPAHAPLLAAMRALRPIAQDQGGNDEVSVAGDLLAPFLARYAGGPPAPERLRFMAVLLGTLVDLYLVAPEPADRAALRGEIEAHMLLALERALAGDG